MKHTHQGCDLFYSVEGSGPPVLFIQGVGVHGAGWQPQTSVLARKFSCLTFDNRGMGQSQPYTGKLTLEQMASDAQAMLDAQGWDSAHVVGHSMGGLIAQALALNIPTRVRSLSLLCTFPNGKNATQLTARMLWLGLRTHIGTRRMRRHAFLEMVLPPQMLTQIDQDAWAEKLAPLFGHDLADQPPIVMKQLSAMSAYDATPRLKELGHIPTLVVSAEFDPIARPQFGRDIAAGIPNAQYVELTNSSHGVPIHDPERVNTLLMEHLEMAERKI